MAHRQLAILLYAANYAAFTAKGLRLAPLWGGGSMGWRGAFILRENMPHLSPRLHGPPPPLLLLGPALLCTPHFLMLLMLDGQHSHSYLRIKVCCVEGLKRSCTVAPHFFLMHLISYI